jgi:hypothetical protein
MVEIVDLDLLLQCPQKDARTIGELEEEESSSRSIMEVYFVAKSLREPSGKKPPFIGQEPL